MGDRFHPDPPSARHTPITMEKLKLDHLHECRLTKRIPGLASREEGTERKIITTNGVWACRHVGERGTRRCMRSVAPALLLLETGAKRDALPTRPLAIEQLTKLATTFVNC